MQACGFSWFRVDEGMAVPLVEQAVIFSFFSSEEVAFKKYLQAWTVKGKISKDSGRQIWNKSTTLNPHLGSWVPEKST